MIDEFNEKYEPFSKEAFKHVRPLSEYTKECEEKKREAMEWSHSHIEDYDIPINELVNLCD